MSDDQDKVPPIEECVFPAAEFGDICGAPVMPVVTVSATTGVGYVVLREGRPESDRELIRLYEERRPPT